VQVGAASAGQDSANVFPGRYTISNGGGGGRQRDNNNIEGDGKIKGKYVLILNIVGYYIRVYK